MVTTATENLLGAFGLLVADAVIERGVERTGLQPSAQAALNCIGMYRRCSIDGLRVALGLSHAAAVRCVAGLVDAGLVLRGQGEDRRVAALALTPAGRRLRIALLEARRSALGEFVPALSAPELSQLDRLLRKLLSGATRDAAHAMQLCRLCDEGPCLRQGCPVEAKYPGAPA